MDSYDDLEAPITGGVDWVVAEMKDECPAELRRLRRFVARRSRNLPEARDTRAGTGDSHRPTFGGGTPWNKAWSHVGQRRTVCGPLVNDGQSDDDVFLNLGRGYPDPGRFTIVIWDVGGVEEIPVGTKVCATGTVSLYGGVARIEATLDSVHAELP